jgi:hypothetical protein
MRIAICKDNMIVLNRAIPFKNHTRVNYKLRPAKVLMVENKTLQRVIAFVWERLCV